MPPVNVCGGKVQILLKSEIHLFFLLTLCHPVGASEISDACKPLKKRSRASTDVEMASSQYRDTSDSDSRGLNDPQVLLENMHRDTHRPKQENTVFPACGKCEHVLEVFHTCSDVYIIIICLTLAICFFRNVQDFLHSSQLELKQSVDEASEKYSAIILILICRLRCF